MRVYFLLSFLNIILYFCYTNAFKLLFYKKKYFLLN